MTATEIKAYWISPLYRNGVAYALKVFGPYADACWDVEVYVEDTFCGTKTVERDTHVIADCMDFVNKCIDIREQIEEETAAPLIEYDKD